MAKQQKLNLSNALFYKPKNLKAAHDACVRFAQQNDAPDFRVVVTQEQRHTAGAARNRGLEHATGEWLLFFDSDDEPPSFADLDLPPWEDLPAAGQERRDADTPASRLFDDGEDEDELYGEILSSHWVSRLPDDNK